MCVRLVLIRSPKLVQQKLQLKVYNVGASAMVKAVNEWWMTAKVTKVEEEARDEYFRPTFTLLYLRPTHRT